MTFSVSTFALSLSFKPCFYPSLLILRTANNLWQILCQKILTQVHLLSMILCHPPTPPPSSWARLRVTLPIACNPFGKSCYTQNSDISLKGKSRKQLTPWVLESSFWEKKNKSFCDFWSQFESWAEKAPHSMHGPCPPPPSSVAMPQQEVIFFFL